MRRICIPGNPVRLWDEAPVFAELAQMAEPQTRILQTGVRFSDPAPCLKNRESQYERPLVKNGPPWQVRLLHGPVVWEVYRPGSMPGAVQRFVPGKDRWRSAALVRL